MEDNKSGSESDKDKKMKGRFESYSDRRERIKREEAEEKAAEEKKFRLFPGLIESEEAEEERKTLFEALGVDTKKDEVEEDVETEPKEPLEEEETSEEEPAEAVEASTEIETPPDEITEQETTNVVKQLARVEVDEARQELADTDPGTPENEQAQASLMLMENIQETGSVEDGFEKTVEELELDEEAEPDEETQEEDEELEPVEEAEDEEEEEEVVPAVPTSPTPPTPPVPPISAQAYWQQAQMPPTPNAPSFNVTPASPNTAANQYNVDPNRRRKRAGDLLVGGIIGYLLGRRRGRIKTQAELLPVQEKLEKQVRGLQQEIADSEAKIRKLVAEKHGYAEPAELPEYKPDDFDQQETLTRRSYEAISQAEYREKRSERLGSFLVPKIELETEPPSQDVATMSVSELLDIAANVKLEGVSLRQMYEGGRLDAVGLRRILHEYLRGENFERVLHENLKHIDTPEHLIGAAVSTGAMGQGTYGEAAGFTGSPAELQPLQSLQPLSNITPTQAQPLPYDYKQQQNRQAAIMGVATGVVVAVVVLILLALFA